MTWIPHLSLEPSEDTEFHFTLRWRQFPIALAFAMTVNKSQGQTVDHVGIDLRVPSFSHRQLYVECSNYMSTNPITHLGKGGHWQLWLQLHAQFPSCTM